MPHPYYLGIHYTSYPYPVYAYSTNPSKILTLHMSAESYPSGNLSEELIPSPPFLYVSPYVH